MDEERWHAVDDLVDRYVLGDEPDLREVLAASSAAGLPEIQVTAAQGKLLQLLARMVGAERVLEVGTLGGYSTVWLARGLSPGGRVTTLEVDAHHASVAEANLVRAGVADRVDVRVGAALQTLPALAEEDAGPYDLVFIDADKRNNPAYVEWALRLSHPGTVIVVDNVVRGGRVLEEPTEDPDVVGTRAVLQLLGDHPRLDATAIQTVGGKGYDGFALAIVTSTG